MMNARKRCDAIQQNLEKLFEMFKDELKKFVPKFRDAVERLADELAASDVNKKDASIEDVCQFLERLARDMQNLEQQRKDIQKYETYLQLVDEAQRADFATFDELRREFALYEKLWFGRLQWKQSIDLWMRRQFMEIDLTDMSRLVDKLYKQANYCVREIEYAEVAVHFKSEIDDFRAMHMALRSIRDPALSEKQWSAIKLLILSDKGLDLEDLGLKADQLFSNLTSDKYDLQFLMRLGVQKHSAELKEVATQAVKENELNNLMNTVEDFWKGAKVAVRQFIENQDFYVLGDNDELIQQLDDMFMIVSNIMQSKYVDVVREKAEK